MAGRSSTKDKPIHRSGTSVHKLFKNPNVGFTFALLFIDALLVALIIAYVPYTKIDWDAYMSQVSGFLEGEKDYRNLKGDTGPLVYPAGFLYVYSAIQFVTGGQVFPAQILFGILYILNLGIVLYIYVKTDVLPWWALSLLCLSKRVHSIFVLRLFNDCFATTLFHAALALLLNQKWHLGLIIFSGAVSIKMNVLLYAPPLLLLMLKAMDIAGVFSALAGAAIVQKQFRQQNICQGQVQNKKDASERMDNAFPDQMTACTSDGSQLVVPHVQNQLEQSDAERKRASVHDRMRVPVTYDDLIGEEDPKDKST